MIEAWREFIEGAGAVFENGIPAHFGDSAREYQQAASGDVIADLSDFGLICLKGPDKETFLQGQVTSDVREVSDENSQLSAMCSPRGRMLANFRIIRRDDALYLFLPRSMLAPVLKRLQMFVLQADVQLTDASDEFVAAGLQGTRTAREAEKALGQLPRRPEESARFGAVTAIRLAGEQQRFLVIAPVDAARNLWEALTKVAAPVASNSWGLTDILAGMPTIYPQTADAFVPQMVNYQAVGGVSFTKGCYTGQEVVARMQYLGKLKRRMYRARVRVDAPPMPGDNLFSENCESAQGAGRVVAAQPHPDGGYEILAVIQIETAEKDTVRLTDASGPTLALESLPYPLET